MPPPRAWIAVVGPGSAADRALELAEDAGAEVAAAGCGLVCGGLGGVMEAACRGSRSRGGLTLGLLPGLDREAANGWVVVAVPTGLGEARNALGVRAADAVVAIGGGWGPLREIALARKACRWSGWGRGSRRSAARRWRASSPATTPGRRSRRRCVCLRSPGAESSRARADPSRGSA